MHDLTVYPSQHTMHQTHNIGLFRRAGLIRGHELGSKGQISQFILLWQQKKILKKANGRIITLQNLTFI